MTYLRYLLKFCSFFILTSPFKNTRLFRVCVMILFSLWLSWATYSLYGKCFVIDTLKNYSSLKVVQTARIIFGSIVFIEATIHFIFLRPENLKCIISSITDFDRQTPKSCKKMRSYFWLCLFLSTVISISSLLLNQLYWLVFPNHKYFIEEDFTYFRIEVGVFCYFWLAVEICRRCKTLNSFLKTVNESLQEVRILFKGYKINISSVKPEAIQQLQEISRLYNNLNGILQDLNKFFGLFILFYILFTGSFIMEKILKSIYYTLFKTSIKHLTTVSTLAWIYFCQLSLYMARISAIAAVGSYLIKEADNTMSICYNIIHSLEHDTTSEAELLKEELRHLANQVMHRQPYLSAAGFFVIDFSIMGSIAYSITSYIIVALQFLRDE